MHTSAGTPAARNFELSSEETLPYGVLDDLRLKHAIDLTGVSLSMTRRGSMYRSYVVMRGHGA